MLNNEELTEKGYYLAYTFKAKRTIPSGAVLKGDADSTLRALGEGYNDELYRDVQIRKLSDAFPAHELHPDCSTRYLVYILPRR